MITRFLPALLALTTTFLLLSVAAASAATPTSVTRTAGDTTATLWDTQTDGYAIRIERAGETHVDGTLSDSRCSSFTGCIAIGLGNSSSGAPLIVRNIDMDPDPEIVVGVSTGGAACCFQVHVYDWHTSADGSGMFRRYVKDFGRAPVRLANLDKDDVREFVTADSRFSGRYASSADSWLPVRIHHLWDQGKRFADVTHYFPSRLRADRNQALAQARRVCKRKGAFRNTMGYYAGYAASQYRLGARAAALRVLRAEQRKGCIVGGTAKQRRTFITRLDKHLRSIGYNKRA